MECRVKNKKVFFNNQYPKNLFLYLNLNLNLNSQTQWAEMHSEFQIVNLEFKNTNTFLARPF